LVILKKLEQDYDPTNRVAALSVLEEAERNNTLLTGLLYVDPNAKTLFDRYNLPETPLNRMPSKKLRPKKESLDMINKMLFLRE